MAVSFNLAGTARSLLNIEANTIVRDNMTAEPMPPLPHALLDIASQYARRLLDLGADLHAYFLLPLDRAPAEGPAFVHQPGDVADLLTVSPDTFDRLRWAAKYVCEARAALISTIDRVLLERIINNCDAIKEMFKQLGGMAPYLGLNRDRLTDLVVPHGVSGIGVDDLVALQKIWDIGLEVIVAQTIVRVTGDVTTRVQEALTRPGGEALFAIHRQTVDVSVGCWRDLLRVVSEIAGAAIGTLLGAAR